MRRRIVRMSRKITRSSRRKEQGRKVKNGSLFCPRDKVIYLSAFKEFKNKKKSNVCTESIRKTTRDTLLSEKLPQKQGEISSKSHRLHFEA